MRIAFLGLGQMGLAIARRLLEAKHDVTVWNRTASSADPLVAAGAKAAATPGDAVVGAEVVLTMLLDDDALRDVMFGQGAMQQMAPQAIHLSLSTISVALADELHAKHIEHGQRLISVPVFGRPAVAAEGKLWLVAAGPADAIDHVKPLLASFSRGLTVVGERPSAANATKVAGNFLITSTIAALSEAFTVVKTHGVDPDVFLEAINSALFQSPFYANYGKLMIHPPKEVGATVKLGAKDTRLFRDAAGKTPTPLADTYQKALGAAIEAGNGDQDWASGYFGYVQQKAQG